jgi:hypothetical protein
LSHEAAFAAFAALMRAVDTQQLSLRGFAPRDLDKKLAAIERACQKLSSLVNEPEVKLLGGIGAEAMGLASKHFRSRTREVRGLMNNYRKPSAAREACIGPLLQCFAILFGNEPKRVGSGQKKKVDGYDSTHGPFVRFAHAFFKEMKCPCTLNTVKAEVRNWRSSTGKTRGGKLS